MITQSIKIGLRRLNKFKTSSFINIVGFSIAIAVSLVILLYANYHYSFDHYVHDSKNSYRIISCLGNGGTYRAYTFAFIDDVLSDCPEVKSYTTNYIYPNNDVVYTEKNTRKQVNVKDLIFVNSSFIDYFSPAMITGDKNSINQPNTMFVTPVMALKLFPNNDAMGKTIYIRSFTSERDSLISYTITGIINPLPVTSSIEYEILLSQQGHFRPSVEHLKENKVFGASLYLKLYPSTDIKALEKKISDKIQPKFEGRPGGPPMEAFHHQLQPIYDIHFNNMTEMEMRPTVRRSSINILLLVGLLIVIIATVNFVNMNNARIMLHQKESNIIRFLGGNTWQLLGQMFVEILVSVFISFLLVIAFSILFKSTISEFLSASGFISVANPLFWIISVGLFLTIILIVFAMSSILFLKLKTSKKKDALYQNTKATIPLVIFQFGMVIGLVGFTFLVNKQMNFINHKSLGYSAENVLIIQIPQHNAKVNVLRNEIIKMPGVVSAATAMHYPGFRLQDMNFANGENSFDFKFGIIDENALQTLNINPLKYFTPAKEKATNGWFINETFYNHLREHYSDEQIMTNDFPGNKDEPDKGLIKFVILGVMKDFNYASLHTPIDNFAFSICNAKTYFNRFVLVRFQQSQSKMVIDGTKDKMAEIYPGQPFNYDFLDEQLHNQYKSEQTLLSLINLFSVLSIIVACLGLLGLSIYIANRRTKEIGIRKVNGARVAEVMAMLNKDFVKWIAIAFVVACPISWFAMHKWLQNSAYKTELSWWVFVAAGGIAFVIALFTVSW